MLLLCYLRALRWRTKSTENLFGKSFNISNSYVQEHCVICHSKKHFACFAKKVSNVSCSGRYSHPLLLPWLLRTTVLLLCYLLALWWRRPLRPVPCPRGCVPTRGSGSGCRASGAGCWPPAQWCFAYVPWNMHGYVIIHTIKQQTVAPTAGGPPNLTLGVLPKPYWLIGFAHHSLGIESVALEQNQPFRCWNSFSSIWFLV